VPVAALAVLGLVAAAAFLIWIDPGVDHDHPPASEPPAATDQPAQPAPGGTAPPVPGQDLLPEVGWGTVCGVTLPFSTSHGPQQHDGDRGYGFARTPTGALLAALHLAVQVSPQSGPDVFAATLAEQVTGPDAAVFAHEVHSQYERLHEQAALPYGQPLCPIYGRFVGLRLDSYHEQAASLRLLLEAPGPDGVAQLAAVIVQVSWLDGDWRLVAPPHGDWSRVSSLQPASALDRYTPIAPGR
jgi:hypothetical protein